MATCTETECQRTHYAHGMCNLHYQRWRTLRSFEVEEGGSKTCAKCKEGKHISKFGRHPGTKDGRRPDCMKCHASYHREARKNHPEKYRSVELKKYKLTIDLYDRMVKRQDGKCAICLLPATQGRASGRYFCIDHDHETGRIRGLLCSPCNKGIGHLGDSPERLNRAAEYLLKGRS